MFHRVGEESELITCPYNVSHQILRSRFQVHLVRCRKSYPNAEVAVCPFNITHRVNKQEINWHVSNCPNRQSFEVFKCNESVVQGLSSSVSRTFNDDTTDVSEDTNTTFETANETLELESSQNWDNLPRVPSYNPKTYAEKANVLRLPVGMQPSQRAAFRNAERKRLQNM